MKKIYRLIVLLLSLCIVISCTACNSSDYGSANDVTMYSETNISTTDTALIAQNSKYEMHWNNEEKNIYLKDKTSGATWSTNPADENGTSLTDENDIYSPVNLEYIIRSAFKTQTVTGKAGAVNKDGVSAEKVDNGLKVTYLFKDLQISIPIDFVLSEQGLEISIDLAKIGQNADETGFRSFKISLAPYMCSVKNSSNNYLFVPSGSGALMYTDERGSGLSRTFSGKVYGEDATEEKKEEFSSAESVKLPVFGAQNGNNTISCIVKEGAEMCVIKASAGDKVTGVSNAYAEFQISGYNGTIMDYGGSTGKKMVNYYSYERISTGKISVLYTPITTETNGYVNIADNYRNYLSENEGLNEESADSDISLVLYGGMEFRKHLFGIPYNTVVPLTSFTDALSILKDFESENIKCDVKLVGYGENGLNLGKLAGGFTYSKKLGSKKEFEELKNYCEENKIDLYFDYDIINFSKSGNGFSTNNDNASTANGYPAQRLSFSPATGAAKDGITGALLNRDKLSSALDKVISSSKKLGLSSISLSTLSNTIYSDFSNKDYEVCNNTEKQYNDLISKIKKSDLKVSGSSANGFMASKLDKIFDAPVYSGKYESFDYEVPFYQIVFKGYVPYSSESINIADNTQKQFLKSIEVGGGVQFTLINNYTSEYASYLNDDIQAMVYENNVSTIKEIASKTADVYKQLKGAKVVDYEIINNNVRKTEFSNGTVIYVNYGTEQYASDEITVNGLDFRMVI